MARLLRLCSLFLIFAAAPAAAFERTPLPSEGAMEACPEQGAGFGRIPGTSCQRAPKSPRLWAFKIP